MKAIVNEVQWYELVLRRDKVDMIKKVLDFEVIEKKRSSVTQVGEGR